MDSRIGFEDGCFFDDQSLSCPSSASSFSASSSSCDVYTPSSGRSTPARRIRTLDYDNIPCSGSIAYDLTPPASALSNYFPQDIKNSFPDLLEYDPITSTPSRKASLQTTHTMEFDYPQMYHHIPTVDPANSHLLGQFAFAEPYNATPFPSNSAFSLDVLACHDVAAWPSCHDDSPSSFFGSLPSPVGSMTPHHLHHDLHHQQSKRRIHFEDIQQKTSALHRAQQGKPSKRDKLMDFTRIPQGMYRCDFAECANRRPFKRQEHLKRHKETKHKLDGVIFSCPFCSKTFNRRDNYRSHLLLHTKQDRTISRTRYDPRALALYEEEMRNTKHRNFLKKKKVDSDSIEGDE
ncbi:tramtrack [Microdochium nivale]|nr:tramtrack [Microdochium nivale]